MPNLTTANVVSGASKDLGISTGTKAALRRGFEDRWGLTDVESACLFRYNDDNSETRLTHILEVARMLGGLFRDTNTEKRWLRESTKTLNDHTPLCFLTGGSIENMALVQDYIYRISGL